MQIRTQTPALTSESEVPGLDPSISYSAFMSVLALDDRVMLFIEEGMEKFGSLVLISEKMA